MNPTTTKSPIAVQRESGKPIEAKVAEMGEGQFRLIQTFLTALGESIADDKLPKSRREATALIDKLDGALRERDVTPEQVAELTELYGRVGRWPSAPLTNQADALRILYTLRKEVSGR